jgi:hypothetical protein
MYQKSFKFKIRQVSVHFYDLRVSYYIFSENFPRVFHLIFLFSKNPLEITEIFKFYFNFFQTVSVLEERLSLTENRLKEIAVVDSNASSNNFINNTNSNNNNNNCVSNSNKNRLSSSSQKLLNGPLQK